MLSRKQYGEFSSIQNPLGLATTAIFEFLLELAGNNNTIKVIYGAGYDWNMWLSDVPLAKLTELYEDGSTVWNGYRIGWQRGKAFRLSHYPHGKTVTIYDVVSFFQCPFVKACDDYLGTDYPGRDVIIANKAKRNVFSEADTAEMLRYNELELDTLDMLMSELRARLNKVGLRPRRWDGPGAIAAALLIREKVKDKRGAVPLAVAEAARYAYAGGRFETIRYGSVTEPAWQYDINSAYPSAIRHLPDLSQGHWTTDTSSDVAPFALYHVEYHGKRTDIPGPLFRRDRNGSVCYPLHVTGWYWTPEYETAKIYCDERWYGEMTVLERHVFHPASDSKPFAFVEPLYNRRRALKKAGDGAHVGLKLALNSIYGKLCQQVGWRNENGVPRIPPYHCLEWAGYITSHCRAQIMRAILLDPEAIIAVETDAVFSSRPLPSLTVGSGLGEWSKTVYRKLTYAQSGLYFGDGAGGKAKTRGIDRGNLTEADCITTMFSDEPYVTVTLRRFLGLGVALRQGMDKWRQWQDMEKTITLRPTGKRIHSPTCLCRPGQWHETMCPMLNDAHSVEFPIEWINPNPEMDLALLREDEHEYDM